MVVGGEWGKVTEKCPPERKKISVVSLCSSVVLFLYCVDLSLTISTSFEDFVHGNIYIMSFHMPVQRAVFPVLHLLYSLPH